MTEEAGITMVFTNLLHSYGNRNYSPGGTVWQQYASLRIELELGYDPYLMSEHDPQPIKAQVVDNKMGLPLKNGISSYQHWHRPDGRTFGFGAAVWRHPKNRR